MRIINTVKGKKAKVSGPRDLIFFLVFCLGLAIFTGCSKKDVLEEAKNFSANSETYYRLAESRYRSLIAKGKDLDRLHFALGELYFAHGEFVQAVGEFQKANVPLAKKFAAISHYKLGNFIDALEIFSKEETLDEEGRYYYGLTNEKLNLFDQALENYKKIKAKAFVSLAKERIDTIEKQFGAVHIKNISPQVYKMISEAPVKEIYPQAGALILYCDEDIEVSSKNTQLSSLHYVIKILNERGKEEFSEIQIGYDSTYEKVELVYARTIRPDGIVTDVGSRHIRDVSRYMNFPLYSNARVFIISFPEIAEGASIEYKVKIHCNQLVNKKDFILNYQLQESEPVLDASFRVSLPKGRTLNMNRLNEEYNNFAANLIPDLKEEQGRLIYSWRFKNIPQIIPEPSMPAGVEINPTILASTFSNWQDVYNWWWRLAKDKIIADPAIKEKVASLIRGKNSEEAKIRAIYNFCAKEIRYVAVEYGQAGYEPHLAGDIFKNKYGDCKDQAILLVTMLKHAGFSAWPVLISTKEYYNLNEYLPSISFNHCIACVSVKGELVFLDPTAETCSFADLPVGDQDRKVLVFKDDTYQIKNTPEYPAGHNLIKQTIRIKINQDESMSAQKNIFSYGVYDQAQRYWLLYTPPELVEQALQEKIQGVSIGARLANYNIKNAEDLNIPVILDYAFSGPEYFINAGPLRISPELAGVDTSLVAKDKRKYPIDFSILDAKETIFEIEIPRNFAIKYIPESVFKESPWGRFNIEYSRQDNKVFFEQKSELKKRVVSQEEYPAFKQFFEGLAKEVKQRIVLERMK